MSRRGDSHREATLFAPPLPEGGTIGVPAPSNPYFNRSDVLRGVEWWESRGYRVKLSDGIWERDDYVAGSPQRVMPATWRTRSPGFATTPRTRRAWGTTRARWPGRRTQDQPCVEVPTAAGVLPAITGKLVT